MIQRICKWLGFALVVMASAASLAAVPSPPQASPPRIVAVGDLHGDFDAWRQIALQAHLIDDRNRWAGGSTILVQLGDIVDRGPDSLKIISHLMKLQAQAAAAGGRVVVLVGNHEAMNMTGDLRYVTPGEYAAFANANSAQLRDRAYAANKAAIVAAYRAQSRTMSDDAIHAAWLAETPLGKLEHQAAWSPRGQLGRWTIANPAIAKIGDTLFVHGGISVSYSTTPFQVINRQCDGGAQGARRFRDLDPLRPVRAALVSGIDHPQGGGRPNARLPGRLSVDRRRSWRPRFKPTGARRMVIAHTPHLAGIVISNGGRLARIDTGISRYYGGKLSYLEILGGGQLVPHNFDRSPLAAPAH